MPRKPRGGRNGRPYREFDQKIFEGLCHVRCTWEEMENILHCDRSTLNGWCQRTYGTTFSEVYKRFADGGKASVRRNQMNLSKKNASMAIWLGKVLLGQKEEITNESIALEIIRLLNSGDTQALKRNLSQKEES